LCMKKDMISQAVALYKKTLNPNSKWFSQDVEDFKNQLAKESVSVIKEKISRLSVYDSKAFKKEIDKHISVLGKGGMFDVKNMDGKNALS
jgi:hypothetical protein